MLFHIVHGLPGRVRLRTPSRISAGQAQRLAEELDALPGILGVRINPRTGSVLLLYQDETAWQAAFAVLTVPRVPEAKHPAVQVPSPPGARRPGIAPFLRFLFLRPLLPLLLRMVSAVFRALPYVQRGLGSLARGRLNMEVLDASAIVILLLRRDFRTASLLTLLLGFGEALESWTRKKSLARLADSLRLDVDTVWVRRNGQERRVALPELKNDDLVVARAGSAIPVDGVVQSGEAAVNQATMTGEPLGVLRGPGASVFAGTVVEDGEILIRPTGVGDATRLQQIVRYIEESEQLKAGIQGKAERLADAVVPFSFLLAGLVWCFTRNPARAASVLLVDYSCALRLATPLAILSAMKEGAAHGVLVKGGRYLEALAATDVVVFDKTGTLTESRPEVVDVIPAPGWNADEILRLAACLEEHFPHPVARAVVRKAEEKQLGHREEHAEVEYVVAHGIASRLHNKRVLLGSRHYLLDDEGIADAPMRDMVERLTREGRSVLYLAIDGQLVGLIGVQDPPRPEAASVVQKLRELGIRRVIMLTGDDERTAAAVAAQLGITEYQAEILPADKADVVNRLRAEGHTVLMVGDGINDSPALSAADVGVALRDSADLAREVAAVVLTDCRLDHLLTALTLGKATMRRIHADSALTIGLNTAFLFGGLTGLLQPGASAMLHNLTTVGVCLNAMQPQLGTKRRAGSARKRAWKGAWKGYGKLTSMAARPRTLPAEKGLWCGLNRARLVKYTTRGMLLSLGTSLALAAMGRERGHVLAGGLFLTCSLVHVGLFRQRL